MDFYDVTIVIRVRAKDDIAAEVKAEDLLADRDIFGEITAIKLAVL